MVHSRPNMYWFQYVDGEETGDSLLVQGWNLLKYREVILGSEVCLVAAFQRNAYRRRWDIFSGIPGLMIVTVTRKGVQRRKIL